MAEKVPYVLVLKEPYEIIEKTPTGDMEIVKQNGYLYAWSESNCRFERIGLAKGEQEKVAESYIENFTN